MLILSYLILSYLILSYLTLPYLTLPYLTLPYLTLPYLTLPYLKGLHINQSLYTADVPRTCLFNGVARDKLHGKLQRINVYDNFLLQVL